MQAHENDGNLASMSDKATSSAKSEHEIGRRRIERDDSLRRNADGYRIAEIVSEGRGREILGLARREH